MCLLWKRVSSMKYVTGSAPLTWRVPFALKEKMRELVDAVLKAGVVTVSLM